MNNLFASKTLRDPGLHFSILRTRLCVFRLCTHTHTRTLFLWGWYWKKGEWERGGGEFRNMHIEAQLAEAGRKKGNDWRAGCYKLDDSSQTHTKIPSRFTHKRCEDFFPMCRFLSASFAWGYFERLVFALWQVWLKRCNRISLNHDTKDNEKGGTHKKKKEPATFGSQETEQE